MKYLKTAIVGLLLLTGNVWADADADVRQLQRRWAEVNYKVSGDDQLKAFEQLMTEADAAKGRYPDSAPVWIWSGIIKSTYAGAKGGIGALGLAKAARRDLEQALELDPAALDGSAYASLGTLYFSVPGWPVGFGDDEKAEELLRQALALKPDSIDNNYFYASYLIDQHRYDEARNYLHIAQQAPSRPDRPLADSGRHHDIELALQTIAGKQ